MAKSWSEVTGLSLHTKRTFSGGAISASGKSPTISKMVARAAASLASTYAKTKLNLLFTQKLPTTSI